ncbi:NUDIX domain-containing protein [Pseudomaricurvus sp. HS19]|uniref:NUDIX domain-containing protein n=1 Tax=Pseudomaricurvus sp. HS19 TaxID=2692626 RepID=UPI003519FB4B
MSRVLPEVLQPVYRDGDVEELAPDILHRGFFSMIRRRYRHRRYDGSWSGVVERELLLRGQAVGVVLYDPDQDLIGLVEQIRPGAFGDVNGPWCIEVVAGMVEPDEPLESVVWRELQEEADLVPRQVEYICEYMASPGGCDERLHIFCALADLQGLDGGVNGLPEEGEDIRLLILPAPLVFDNLYGGRFNNAATLIGLQWLQLNRERIRAASGAGS